MLSISGITSSPLQSTKSSTATKPPFLKLEERQAFDAFFSNQSIRSQMSRFLQYPPTAPLMFSYTWQEGSNLWNRWFTPPQSVILLKPEIKAPEKNPFSQPLDTETPVPSSNLHINVQQLEGQPLSADTHVQLEQAFKQAGQNPANPKWVHQQQDGMRVITQNDPAKAGFGQVTQVSRAVLHYALGALAPFLGLKIENEAIQLPNGVDLPLKPKVWVDNSGKQANLFKTLRLPNGKWFKLSNVAFEQQLPFKDKKLIRQTVEQLTQQIEERGGIREVFNQVNPLEAIMASAQQQPFTQQPVVTKPFGSSPILKRPFKPGVIRGKAASSVDPKA